VLGNETRSLIAGEAVAEPVMVQLRDTLAHIDCITELEEIATLHLGPGAILVALTLAFRPQSTTESINVAIRELTACLKQADGRVAYVYVRPSREAIERAEADTG
jgi:2-keto-3-deoxy-L-rhamnonate aldolase RhmA